MRVITHGFLLGNLSGLGETFLLLALDDGADALRAMCQGCQKQMRLNYIPYRPYDSSTPVSHHQTLVLTKKKTTSAHLEVASNVEEERYVGNSSDGQEK